MWNQRGECFKYRVMCYKKDIPLFLWAAVYVTGAKGHFKVLLKIIFLPHRGNIGENKWLNGCGILTYIDAYLHKDHIKIIFCIKFNDYLYIHYNAIYTIRAGKLSLAEWAQSMLALKQQFFYKIKVSKARRRFKARIQNSRALLMTLPGSTC